MRTVSCRTPRRSIKALIEKIIFLYTHAHTCIENGPGEHASLITAFISGEGRALGGAGGAQGNCPVNSTLHFVYFAAKINVTGVNTTESNKIFKNLKITNLCAHACTHRQGYTGFDSKPQDLE